MLKGTPAGMAKDIDCGVTAVCCGTSTLETPVVEYTGKLHVILLKAFRVSIKTGHHGGPWCTLQGC